MNVRSAIQQGFEHQGKSIYNIKTKAMQTTVRYMTGNLEIPEISILETLEKSSHLSTSFSLHLLHRIRTSCHLQGLGLYLGTAHRCIPKTDTDQQRRRQLQHRGPNAHGIDHVLGVGHIALGWRSHLSVEP